MIRLLESSPHPDSVPVITAALSFIAHTLLIAGAVMATRPALMQEDRHWDAAEKVIYLIPQDRSRSQRPQQELVQWTPMGMLQSFTGAFRDIPIGRTEQGQRGETLEGTQAGTAPVNAQAIAAYAGNDSVMTVLDVDSAATRYTWSAAPAYPMDMLNAHKEGEVVARYVVDTLGYADTLSFEVVTSSNRAFTRAVRAALPDMRFSPAQWNGQKVRQLVEQKFAFRITDELLKLKASADSAAAIAKAGPRK